MNIILILCLCLSLCAFLLLFGSLILGKLSHNRELQAMAKEAAIRAEIDARNTAMPDENGQYRTITG